MVGNRTIARRPVRHAPCQLTPRAIVAAIATIGFVQGAQAFEIETGNPDINLRWDTQIRYNAGWRMEGQSSAFKNSPAHDSSEAFADRGDMVTNRVDVLTELDFVYKRSFGFRLSGAAWRDFAYGKKAEGDPATSEYIDGRYNGYAKRFHRGPSGELLDAFVFANLDELAVPLRLKLGKHTVYWGEGLFAAMHSISYGQGPIDGLKAATSPGIETKEVFMPVNQFTGQAQLTPELSLAFQYMLDWKPTRIPAGGTYFGTDDSTRADRVVAAVIPGLGALAFPVGDDIEPDRKRGPFGVGLRWSPDWLQGTVGLYYRRFHETLPWGALQLAGGQMGLPGSLHFMYPEDTRLIGVSLSKVVGTIGMGAEISYRKDTALNSAPVPAFGSFDGLEGARGNTWHALVNGMYMLPKTALWEGGTLMAELVYSRLDKVTKNKHLFMGEGYAACDGAGLSKSDGCSTKDFWLVQVNFAPEYPQVFPGVNLTLPMSVSYGLHGNAANFYGGNEGAVTWAVGVTANVRDKYEFSLKYNDSYTKYKKDPTTGLMTTQNGLNANQNDHGWLSFTFKTSF